jgi:hypothetical protein
LKAGILPADIVGQPAVRMLQELGKIQAHGTRRLGILSLLLIFHQTQCQDDRDRLFSIFGVAHGIAAPASQMKDSTSAAILPALIKSDPSYQLSTVQVYINFAIAALQCAFPIDILHCAGAFRENRTTESRTSQDYECLPS